MEQDMERLWNTDGKHRYNSETQLAIRKLHEALSLLLRGHRTSPQTHIRVPGVGNAEATLQSISHAIEASPVLIPCCKSTSRV